MTRVSMGPGRLVSSLALPRLSRVATAIVAGPGDARIAPPPSRRDPAAPLIAAKVPEKVARAHASAFERCAPELKALSELSAGPLAWQVKGAERILEQLYKTLGQVLDETPEAQRPQVTKRALKALLSVVEETSPAVRFAALAAVNGLVDGGRRRLQKGALDLGDEGLGALYTDGARSTIALAERLQGRAGVTSALNVLPRLLEQLERGVINTAADRRALCAGVSELLEHGAPRTGFDLSRVAHIAKVVDEVLGGVAGPAEALVEAKGRLQAERPKEHKEVRQRLEAALADPQPAGRRALIQGLVQIIDANPLGPVDLFTAIDKLNTAALAQEEREDEKVAAALAAILPSLSEASGLAPILEHLAEALWQLTDDRTIGALQAAAKVPAGQRPGKLLTALVRVHYGNLARPEVAALDRLARLSVNPLTAVAAALLPRIDADRPTPELIDLLITRAGHLGDDPVGELTRVIANYGEIACALAWYGVAERHRPSVVKVLALAPTTLDEERAPLLMQSIEPLTKHFPKVPLESVLYDDAQGRPGLLSLSATNPRRAISPLEDLPAFLQTLHKGGATPEAQRAAVRLAFDLANELSYVFGAREQVTQRVQADLQVAVKHPAKLKSARPQDSARLRAQGASAVAYPQQNPELPLELAFTAGLHLSSADLAWVSERLSEGHGRDSARLIRDMIFAAVERGRPDVVAALRESDATPAAKAGVIKLLAQAFRVNQEGQLDLDTLVAGLRAGEDPVAKAQEQQIAQTMKDLGIQGKGAARKFSPEGLAEISALGPNVAELLEQYRPGFKSMDHEINMGKLGPVFRTVLDAVLAGTWPAPKYEDPVGVRQLQILTPAQQKIWRSTTVTRPGQQTQLRPDAEVLSLIAGLGQLLREGVSLVVPGLPGLGFDPPSEKRVKAALNERLGAIRAARKGSREHQRLALELRPTREALALLELEAEIRRVSGRRKESADSALLKLRPLLLSAQRVLDRLGAPALVAVTADLLAWAPRAEQGGREGRHAADEDSLTAMIASHTSGCLSFGSNLRRWGMAGSLADANTKMLRVFEGDRQLYRAFMRLVPIETRGYQGPALYVEAPIADGGGSQDDATLLALGLYQKAAAMGVPVFGSNYPPPDGWHRVEDQDLTIHFDYGHTGLYHSDNLGQQIHQKRVGKPWTLKHNDSLAFPPGVGPAKTKKA